MFFALITSPLTAVLGYLYPAYMSYKAVEKRQPNIDELLFWGKYWIVIGVLSAVEEMFLGLLVWVPFYSLVRLVLMVYMWHPRTQGVLLLYHRAVQPMLMKHEEKIDRGLHEVNTRGTDLAMEGARTVAAQVQTALQKGQGLVKQQYQSFSKRAPPAGYPAPAPGYGAPVASYAPAGFPSAPPAPGYVPDAAMAGVASGVPAAGGPDSMLRTRKGYETQAPY